MNKFITISLVILLSGCIALPIPNDRRKTPLYYGKVQDSASQSPIQDVLVKVETFSIDSETEAPIINTTKTDENGHYEIGAVEESGWYVLYLGPAEGICGGKVTFSHPDYDTYQYHTETFTGAAVNGACNGEEQERNVLLSRKTSNKSLKSGTPQSGAP